MVVWSNEETFRFIELYQQESCIWNPKNKQHKDKTKTNEAWLRISDAMDVPVVELKKKKESLMAAFRMNHKRVLTSHQAGDAEVFKPIWQFYDAMAAFASDIYECKSMMTPEYLDEEKGTFIETPFSQLLSSPQVSYNLASEVEAENTSRAASRVFVSKKRRRFHKPIEVQMQETNVQVKNALTTLHNALIDNNKKQREDDCALFGRLIAKKLRFFSESDRQELMFEIDGLILEKRRSVDAASSS